MEPTSAQQLRASTEGGTPGLERVAGATWALGLPLPATAAATVPYTLCYILRDSDGAAHLVDPGVGSDENADLLKAALLELSVSKVVSVVTTHLHPDHLGMADRVRAGHGALLVMHVREQEALRQLEHGLGSIDISGERWGVPADEYDDVRARADEGAPLLAAPADVLVRDDDLLDIPGRRIRVISTPGHTIGHMCLRDEEYGHLFTGDHVLPTVNPGLGLGGVADRGPLEEYLESLDRIRVFDEDEVLPGHGYRFRGLAERVAETAAHHRERTSEVAGVLAESPGSTVWEVASQVSWTAGWQNLHGFLRRSALLQTEMHMRYLTAAPRHVSGDVSAPGP